MSIVEKLSISLRPGVVEQIDVRGTSRSTIVNRDLDRLYTLYRRALARIELTVDEACLIVDALNGSLMDANTVRMLWASIEDACQLNGLDTKWSVDGPGLVEKLRKLNEVQAMAVADAAERAWNISDQNNFSEIVISCFDISR